MDMNMTFSGESGDNELIVNISENTVSFDVYNGRTALFKKKDAAKVLATLLHIIGEG